MDIDNLNLPQIQNFFAQNLGQPGDFPLNNRRPP
jgi:hypothetical protein